ncbi:MAG: helix-turn-helix domain-containing protein [Clostridia bacterium]
MINKEILKKEIGIRVKEIREKKMHMTKVQFADLIGMKNQYLGTVENGQRGLTVEKSIEICEKANVSCDYLLRGIDNSLETHTSDLLNKYTKDEVSRAFEIMKDYTMIMK